MTYIRPTAHEESFTNIFTGGSVALGMEHLGLASNTESHCEFVLETIYPGEAESTKAHVRIFKVGKRAPGDSTSLDAFRPAHAESKGWRHAIEWNKRGSEHTSEGNLVGAGGRVAGTAGDENHYLAVATSPPAGWRIEAGESGHFGIGWHAESHHDAGMNAARQCREHGGGSACSFDASGTSLRGGCVGLAMASWRDRDKEPERTYVVTSSSFRDLIARDLRAGCGSTAFSGKHEGTVVEHSCEIVRIMCAGDGFSADGTPNAGP